MTHPNVFPICARTNGVNGGSGHTPPAPIRQPWGVVHIPLETLASLTRDAGMQEALRDLDGPARHVEVRSSWFAELRQDWRDILTDVRASPYSHALVAIATVIGWTVLLVLPTLLGAGR